MNCKNCGAPIDASALTCPYCGFENEAAATEAHERELRGIYAQIARIFHLPAERARKVTNYLMIGAAALVALFVAALIASHVYRRVAPTLELVNQQEIVARLEEMYRDGDYDAIGTELNYIPESYRAVYDKYTLVSDFYRDVTDAEEFTEEFADDPYCSEYHLADLLELLAECDELEANGYVYGEQAAVAEFRERARAVLRDYFLLTDAEIDDAVATLHETNALYLRPDYTDIVALCEERMGGAE